LPAALATTAFADVLAEALRGALFFFILIP
jgi:hypothetical protein